ncbi:MAG TPA: glycosyltransferase [Methylophilaceae bacterium]|jgi:glycosyltransferase involved in cell wall biosynthesis
MKPVRIAYFINQYPKVSHSFIRREIQALERQGFNVQRIAARGWSEPLADEADLLEREQTRYVLRGGVIGLLMALAEVIFTRPLKFVAAIKLALKMGLRADRPLPIHFVYLAEACYILLWMRQFGAQHVHAHFGTNSAEVVMLAHALGGPAYSFTVHGPEEFDKPQFLKLREKVEHAAFVVAISSYGRSQLYRWVSHADWPKVNVVHCGLESDFFETEPVPLSLVPRVVCVGRLCEQKGQLLLVGALSQLQLEGIDIELVLAGDGEMRAEIEKLVEQLNLQDKVRITGWISSDQVKQEILAARALVLPSFAEGLPVVIMESMALRRPVITTSIAGIPELVGHGEHGWLCAAGDVSTLVEQLKALLATPFNILKTMGDAAHARVKERHAIDTETAKLAQYILYNVKTGVQQ